MLKIWVLNANLALLGNLIAQFSQNSTHFDYKQAFYYWLYAFVTSPLLSSWYKHLDSWYPITANKKRLNPENLKTVVKRVATDQLLFSPFSLVLFLCFRFLAIEGDLEVVASKVIVHLISSFFLLCRPATAFGR